MSIMSFRFQLSMFIILLIIALLQFSGHEGNKQDEKGSSGSKKELEKNVEDSWSQFRGPTRSGVLVANSPLHVWTAAGPKLLWKHAIGDGFSGIVIADENLITAFAEDSTEFVASFDKKTGKENWRVEIGKMFIDQFGNGPRSTPVLDDDGAFVLASYGQVHAINKKTGQKIWTVSLADTFEIKVPARGFSTSPLVQDGLVIVHSGGGKGEGFVALDKNTGQIAWKTGNSEPSYSSPIVATINGMNQSIFASTRIIEKDGKKQSVNEIISLSTDGRILWKGPSLPSAIAMPVFIEPDKVFVSGSLDVGCLVFQVVQNADSTEIVELWRNREMRNHFSSSVYYKNHIYGFSKSTLKCLDVTTAERKWAKRGFGKGTLIIVDDKLLVLSDRGKLAIVEATGEGFHQLAVAQVLNSKSWTSPTFVDGKIYLRNRKEMACYDLTN